MTSTHKLLGGVLVLAFALGGAAFPSGKAAPTEATSGSLSVEMVADYIHAVIEADREVYTKHVVERMQAKGVVVASENWEYQNTVPLPAQFLMESGRVMERIRYGRTVSIDQQLADQQAECRLRRVSEGWPGCYSCSSDPALYRLCEGRDRPLLPGRLSGSCCDRVLHRLP